MTHQQIRLILTILLNLTSFWLAEGQIL